MWSPEPGAAWSLRRRLALALLLSVGAVLVAMFLVLDHWIDREIYQRMDHTLLERARTVSNTLQERDLAQLERLMPEYDPDGHTEFFTVYDAAGHALLHSSSSGGVGLAAGPAARGTPRYYDVTLPDGHAGRALATRLPGSVLEPARHSQPARLLVVATEREGWDRTERRIHFTLLGGVALALLAVLGLGLLVLQRAFAVLRRAGDAVARLPADAPPQPIGADFPAELRPFAAAIDTGLQRLYASAERERRFARDVAHELRTPLAEMRAIAEAALADGSPAAAGEGLRAAVAASERMRRSVDTLLQLSRLESGLEAPALDPLDLAVLVADLTSALHATAAAHGVSVHRTGAPAAWVRSDYGIVERIVSNLLRNAIEYAPAGSRVECRVECADGQCRLAVSNAAPDLMAEDLHQFGRRFWRKQSEGGTAHHAGLGLALAFGLAQALAVPLRFELEEGCLAAWLGPWPTL